MNKLVNKIIRKIIDREVGSMFLFQVQAFSFVFKEQPAIRRGSAKQEPYWDTLSFERKKLIKKVQGQECSGRSKTGRCTFWAETHMRRYSLEQDSSKQTMFKQKSFKLTSPSRCEAQELPSTRFMKEFATTSKRANKKQKNIRQALKQVLLFAGAFFLVFFACRRGRPVFKKHQTCLASKKKSSLQARAPQSLLKGDSPPSANLSPENQLTQSSGKGC